MLRHESRLKDDTTRFVSKADTHTRRRQLLMVSVEYWTGGRLLLQKGKATKAIAESSVEPAYYYLTDREIEIEGENYTSRLPFS